MPTTHKPRGRADAAAIRATTNETLKSLAGLVRHVAARHGLRDEDSVQELMVKLWQALPKFDGRKSPLSVFAFHILTNAARDLVRAAGADKRRFQAAMARDLPDVASRAPGPAELAEESELREICKAADAAICRRVRRSRRRVSVS